MANNAIIIRDFLRKQGLSDFAVFGMMGNIQAESGLNSRNMENSYEKKLGFTDDTYIAAVDGGAYANFTTDRCGFGLCQWTAQNRKAGLLDLAKRRGKSIGDINIQLEWLWAELSGAYIGVLNGIKAAKSIREASDIVLTRFECPADQSERAKQNRAALGETLYAQYGNGDNPYPVPTGLLRYNSRGNDVRWLQVELNNHGYQLIVDGIFGTKTDAAVRDFQQKNGLVVDGIVGPATMAKLEGK